MVKVGHNGNAGGFGQMAEHAPKNRQGRMFAAARSGLQDDRCALRLGGGDVGAHILPAKTDEAGDSIAAFQRRLQNLSQGRKGHLNLATMSMMPGMVCNWAAWVGWKYCFRLRWDRPPRMVK